MVVQLAQKLLDAVVIAASIGKEIARGERNFGIPLVCLQLVKILGWKEMPSFGGTYFVFCSAFLYRNFSQDLIKVE